VRAHALWIKDLCECSHRSFFKPTAAAAARRSRYAYRTSARTRVRFDPSLARGLSYYTGAIMEIAVPDLAGSLGGGGRYDNLIGMFLGRDVPACGFSLGLERIIVVMTERGDEVRLDAAQLAGDALCIRCRASRADDGDTGAIEERELSARPEGAGRVGEIVQRGGVAGVVRVELHVRGARRPSPAARRPSACRAVVATTRA